MSNTAVVSTPAAAPVNATGNTPNAPGSEQGVKAPEGKAKPVKAAPKYDTPFDRVLAELNEKHGGDPEEFRKMGDIADDVQSGKVSKELGKDDEAPTALKNPPAKKSADPADEQVAEESSEDEQAETERQKAAAAKRKLKVGDQEYELDEDQRDRFAQKGIYYEKQNVALTKEKRAVEAEKAQLATMRQEQEGLLQAMAQDPGAVLEELFGREKAFQMLKPWAAKQVQTEQQFEENPHLRQIQEANARAERAEATLKEQREQAQEAEISQHEKKLVAQYQKTITDAMELGGIAKTDFTAAEMAGYMRRAAQRGIDYTPQQLAEIVRDDNMSRVGAMTSAEVTAITEARKTGDQDAILKHGQRLADMLGEQVVYALAKFHLAKMSGKQRQQPKPILDTTKAKPDANKGAGGGGKKPGYMPWDEWQDKRRARAEAIDRGEQVEEW